MSDNKTDRTKIPVQTPAGHKGVEIPPPDAQAVVESVMVSLNATLDARLGMMVAVVGEATRAAASASGSVMEVRGQLQGVHQGLRRVEEMQRRTDDKLGDYAARLVELKAHFGERGIWCGARFDQAADQLKDTWKAADRTFQKALHSLETRLDARVSESETRLESQISDLSDKLGEVRETTDVRAMRDLRLEAERRGREKAFAKVKAKRDKRNARLLSLGRIAVKILPWLIGVGAGGYGAVELVKMLFG